MDTLRIDILPEIVRQEILDYYEFLLSKYKIDKKNYESKRPYALARDEFKVPDSFNEPLPDDIINNFYKD